MPHCAWVSMRTFWEGNKERKERTVATKNGCDDSYAWILFFIVYCEYII